MRVQNNPKALFCYVFFIYIFTMGNAYSEKLNDDKATKAINKYLSKKCFYDSSFFFPEYGAYLNSKDPYVGKLQGLLMAGILERENIDINKSKYIMHIKRLSSMLTYGDDPKIEVTKYLPSKNHEDIFKEKKRSSFSFNHQTAMEICLGHFFVNKIDNFSIPTAYNGKTVSEVQFSVLLKTLPWVKESSILYILKERKGTKSDYDIYKKWYPKTADFYNKENPMEKVQLILTSKGWIVGQQ